MEIDFGIPLYPFLAARTRISRPILYPHLHNDIDSALDNALQTGYVAHPIRVNDFFIQIRLNTA